MCFCLTIAIQLSYAYGQLIRIHCKSQTLIHVAARHYQLPRQSYSGLPILAGRTVPQAAPTHQLYSGSPCPASQTTPFYPILTPYIRQFAFVRVSASMTSSGFEGSLNWVFFVLLLPHSSARCAFAVRPPARCVWTSWVIYLNSTQTTFKLKLRLNYI